MKIILNGKGKNIKSKSTLHQLINVLKLNPEVLIVEVNEQIIKKKNWKDYQLKSGDKLELVTYVGGG